VNEKIVKAWVSGDGFTNYPDPQFAHDYDRLADLFLCDCPETEVPDGQSVPLGRGNIVLADLRGGHRVIITDVILTAEGFEYEGVPLSAGNGHKPDKGWVRVNDYNSIIEYGLLAPDNYGVYIQVRDLFRFTSKNICRKEYFHPLVGHAKPNFMETLKSWLGMSDEALMKLNADTK
jgi:hypothetical protein